MEPVVVTKEKASISAIRWEIMGASSSMNMPPEPLDKPEGGEFYMTELYTWAKHAHEHCIAAMHNSNALYSALDGIAWELRKKGDFENAQKILDILYR